MSHEMIDQNAFPFGQIEQRAERLYKEFMARDDANVQLNKLKCNRRYWYALVAYQEALEPILNLGAPTIEKTADELAVMPLTTISLNARRVLRDCHDKVELVVRRALAFSRAYKDGP